MYIQTEQYCKWHNVAYFGRCPHCPEPIVITSLNAAPLKDTPSLPTASEKRAAAQRNGFDDYCEAHDLPYNNECPECADIPKQEEEKKQDWEHLLEMCIYTALIGYTEKTGYSIPCKVREDMKHRAVERFKKELVDRGYFITNQPQEPDGPVQEICEEKKKPHGELTDVVGWIPVGEAFRIADWVDKEIEYQLSTANAQIEALNKENARLTAYSAEGDNKFSALYEKSESQNKEIEALKADLEQVRATIQEKNEWINSHC